jgi:HlyD family secretion protein
MAAAVNEKAENGARTQEVAQAESAYNLWKSTYDRAVVLNEGGAISNQKLEEIKTQMNVAEQTLSMAKEGARTEDKKAASAQLSLAEAGILSSNSLLNQACEASNIALAQVSQAQAGLAASQGKLDQAKAGLQEVEVYLKDTVIKSPIDGTITAINSDEGELVSTGTSIGTVSNLDKCWISINLDENKLEGVSEGQTVDVTLAAYKNKKYKGTVVTINKEPDFAVKKATNENGSFDIVSFGVKIEIDNLDQSIRPGMTAMINFAN